MNARIALSTVLLAALVAPAAASANAGHLLITEVGYDVASNPEDSEWVEIFNPTDVDVVLNDGTAAYYLSDDEDAYWNVVNGVVANSGSDWALTFPVGAVLPARSFVVVVKDDAAWFAEFFPAGRAAFLDVPGNPQVFEFQSDADSTPDMISVGTGNAMSLTNGGEDIVLFRWDGVSDLVQDVDHVCWITTGALIDKSGVTIDGPDADTAASAYLVDAGTAFAAPDSPGGSTIQRVHALETGEITGGGNGITGHDESSEDWSSSFVVANPTPGRFLITTDGDLSDLAAAAAPLAVSMADGPGLGPVGDFGPDGTLTELYAVPEDTTGDGLADVLHVGVRGAFFGSAPYLNGTFVGIDVEPGSGFGVLEFDGASSGLLDGTGSLDIDLSQSSVSFTALAPQGIGMDAALGFTEDGCLSSDVCGLRGLGSDGVAGTLADFAFLGDFSALSDLAIGAVDPALPGAPGTSIAAPDGFEFAVPLADLNDPVTVALAAWTSADSPGGASPNTLPETPNDVFIGFEDLVAVACVGIDDPLPLAYLDADGDGDGDPTTGEPYCGIAPAGRVLNGDDCDDGDGAVGPGAAELCDGDDEDCDGVTDNGFDADGDTFFDAGDAGCVATYGGNVDCDDGDATVFPSAAELCDALDNDCDVNVDEDFDLDGDGFVTNAVNACITTYGPTNVDCADGDGTRYPGAPEVCDGDDENCNGAIDDGFDQDGDTYFTGADAGCVATYGANVDCDDTSGAVSPAVTESCANGLDDDCDGLVDGADADCATGDDDDSATGDDDDATGDDDDSATGDDDDSATGDDDDSATGDDDDATGDDDDSATGDDDDATGDDDDATGDDDDLADDDDATGDDDDMAVDDDDGPDDPGCACSTGAPRPASAAWVLVALGGALVRRRRPGYPCR
jgi:MYXO-CTERM domain-containing protein